MFIDTHVHEPSLYFLVRSSFWSWPHWPRTIRHAGSPSHISGRRQIC